MTEPNSTPKPEPSWAEALAIPLGLVGAILGGILGGYLFIILRRHGLYMPFLVEALAAFAAIGFARRGGLPIALIATPVALIAGLVAHWLAVRHHLKLPDFSFFLRTYLLGEHPPIMLIFHLAAGLVAGIITSLAPARPHRSLRPADPPPPC